MKKKKETMKMKFYITILSLLFVIIYSSCDKMRDIHTNFVKDGEIVYSVAPDTLITSAGNLRIQIKLFVYNGTNIQKCIVEWEDNQERFQESVDVSFNKYIDSVSIIIDNLKEKSYIFKVYNVDKYGNRSIKKQVIGTAYGKNYEKTLLNRDFISTVRDYDNLIINWIPAVEGAFETEMEYLNSFNESISKILSIEHDRDTLFNFPIGGSFSYRTAFMPEPLAIDTFYSPLEIVHEKVVVPTSHVEE